MKPTPLLTRALAGLFSGWLLCLGAFSAQAHDSALPEVIKEIRGSVVGVGTYQYTRRPQSQFMGTGFVVADGKHILTNAHVVPKRVDKANKEFLAIFTGRGTRAKAHRVKEIQRDEEHDVSVLKLIERGDKLKPMKLDKKDDDVFEGDGIAFTGFPIGMVLGLYPVTHRGMISAITPVIEPVYHSRQLNPKLIKRLRDQYGVYQLDATAYPGNSGSPLYRPDTGEVVGIINAVFVKETKEMVIEKPSGITYAIPIKFAKDLLRATGQKTF